MTDLVDHGSMSEMHAVVRADRYRAAAFAHELPGSYGISDDLHGPSTLATEEDNVSNKATVLGVVHRNQIAGLVENRDAALGAAGLTE